MEVGSLKESWFFFLFFLFCRREHTHTHTYIYIYIYVCVRGHIYVCVRGQKRKKKKKEKPALLQTAHFLFFFTFQTLLERDKKGKGSDQVGRDWEGGGGGGGEGHSQGRWKDILCSGFLIHAKRYLRPLLFLKLWKCCTLPTAYTLIWIYEGKKAAFAQTTSCFVNMVDSKENIFNFRQCHPTTADSQRIVLEVSVLS